MIDTFIAASKAILKWSPIWVPCAFMAGMATKNILDRVKADHNHTYPFRNIEKTNAHPSGLTENAIK